MKKTMPIKDKKEDMVEELANILVTAFNKAIEKDQNEQYKAFKNELGKAFKNIENNSDEDKTLQEEFKNIENRLELIHLNLQENIALLLQRDLSTQNTEYQ